MNDEKIIQIIPAPPGSYVACVNCDVTNRWEYIEPASCLALVECTDEDNEKVSSRRIVPLGFGENVDEWSHFSSDYTLHASRSDAEVYIAELRKTRAEFEKIAALKP